MKFLAGASENAIEYVVLHNIKGVEQNQIEYIQGPMIVFDFDSMQEDNVKNNFLFEREGISKMTEALGIAETIYTFTCSSVIV